MADARHAGIGMTSARTRERLVQRLREQGIRDPQVLDRIRNVPRHLFVDEALSSRAYEDTALPIGFGQTISQPYVVARMTEALLGATGVLHNVLEIGTGCGYQTAVLAPLVARVSTVERLKPLLDRAKLHLKELALKNVRFRHAAALDFRQDGRGLRCFLGTHVAAGSDHQSLCEVLRQLIGEVVGYAP